MEPVSSNNVELKMARRRLPRHSQSDEDQEKDKTLNVVDGRISIQFSDDSTLINAEELPMFIDILKKDDAEIFRSWPTDRLFRYTKGKFDYKTCDSTAHHRIGSVYEIPFLLAAGYGAMNVLQEFIRRGVDIRKTDVNDTNILHILSVASSMKRDREEDFISFTNTLLDSMTPDVLVQLCNQENDKGYRPLELAALLGSFAVYNCLLERKGYICGEPRMKGLSIIHPYDISDYEPGGGFSRLIRSPLKLLIYVDKDGFESMKKFKTLQLPVIKQWHFRQLRRCLPFLLLWWVYRAVYLCAISYLDPSVVLYHDLCANTPMNMTRPTEFKDPREKMHFEQCDKFGNYSATDLEMGLQLNHVVVIWSSFMVAVDLVEIILRVLHSDRRKAYRSICLRDFASFTESYRFSILILYIVAIVAPMTGRMFGGGQAFQILLFIKAFQLPMVLYSFLYIVEFMPVLGIFAITMQRMTKALTVFLAFLLPVKFLFSQFFSFFATDEGFTDIWEGVYLLFLLDMGSFDFGNSPIMVIRIVHVLYFLLMIILLFNYLIAVLSIVADQTAEDRKLLVKLRRLQMMGEVEERVAYWFRWLIRRVRCPRNRTIIWA